MARTWLTSFLKRLHTQEMAEESAGAARHLVFDMPLPLVYAVGDVHGRLDLLLKMERLISDDAAGFDATPWVILLGDLVDRGPETAALIDHVMAEPPPGVRRLVLSGNHEALMLTALSDQQALRDWVEMGGRETLMSYGVPSALMDQGRPDLRALRASIAAHLPQDHLDWLAALPYLVETPEAIFVHAGLVPGRPIDRQRDDDLLWYRDRFEADYSGFGRKVVHGHTVVREPLVSEWRIAIDTGAVSTGRLTAVRLAAGMPPHLITATGPRS